MVTRIDEKYFINLYNNLKIAPNSTSKSIKLIYQSIENDDIYTKFIFHIFFSDTIPEFECPSELYALLEFPKIINTIKKNIFTNHNHKVEYKNIPSFLKPQTIMNINIEQEALFILFKFLLAVELSVECLYLSDFDAIFSLIQKMSLKTKIQLLQLNYKISPIVCILLKSIDNFEDIVSGSEPSRSIFKRSKIDYQQIISKYKDFHEFLKILNINFFEGFKNFKVNYKKLEKMILYSKFKIINEYHKIFINYVPDLIYTNKISKNRLDYFQAPLQIPLIPNILRVYIPSTLYFLRLQNPKLNEPNFELLYKLIYIEKIIFEKLTYETKSSVEITQVKKYSKLIHLLFLENHKLIYICLRRKYSLEIIKIFIRYIPSFHYAFEISFKLYLETKDKYYSKILQRLLRKYKIKEYINILMSNIDQLPKRLVQYLEVLQISGK